MNYLYCCLKSRMCHNDNNYLEGKEIAHGGPVERSPVFSVGGCGGRRGSEDG